MRPGERTSVLHVTQAVDAGVARCVQDFADDQAQRGWRVAIACPPDGELASAVRRGESEHLEWHAQREPGASVVRETRQLGRLLERWRPDLVHLHSSKAGLAGRLAVRGRVPTLFQPHGWSFYAVDGLRRTAAVRWERFATRWADAVVCVSEGEAQAGEVERIRARSRVAPNGIDLVAYSLASADDRRAARAELALPETPLAVSVGRVARQKGHDVLLAAWGSIVERIREATLVIVGDGPDREALSERAPENVRFVGPRTDVSVWLAAADVVVLPSRWEAGASLAMLEAMARGRSVVTTSVAGSEAVEGAGAIVPVDDAAALTEAVTERLLDPDRATREGLVGRRTAERAFDHRQTRQVLAGIYGDVLAARRSPSVSRRDSS